ncbi:MAG: FdtA/QdtA family cupin domain-containing protein [Bacteroidales bacterium]|nr:FdtA/QdtA family cupin domain-containing protein [Bacteroidales bacterium]MCD8394983.1 FdtA/QdtA family cupin domain-containing protein [Bacteroidales bacterium]
MEAKIIEIPKVSDPRGNLSFIQYPQACPFEIARCYWVYDVPAGESRVGHAYYTTAELIVALSGSFTVEVSQGGVTKQFRLSHPWQGLYVPPLHWRVIDDFATNSVAMILASTLYDEDDYIRDFQLYTHFNGAE